VSWGEAWRVAWGAGRAGAGVARGLGEALGCALAEPLVALTDLPAFDSSAMDGWAVAGPGPWRLTGQVLAGGSPGAALADGEAVRIATGAPLPEGATAVLRRECGATREAVLYATGGAPGPGQDVRPRGQECRSGDALVAAGRVVTPAVLGLAAAAGYDRLAVVPRPRVELLVLGDELLEHGVPGDGRVRDALGPMLPGWLRTLGADLTAVRRLVDDAEALRAALTATDADVVLTTGGTAAGPADHVHPVLARLGAELLIDGVAVRPGHPMLLARLPGGAHLVGLPGNPLAAVCGVLTLAAPLIGAVAGRAAPVPYRAPLTEAVTGHRAATRLVPVAYDDESRAVPLPFTGPAMLRGLAIADGLAVIPPGGLPRGAEATVLDTCWTPTAGPPAAA
jgi:molybdopterin molybdotransferase